jgi:hypothetical protein
MSAVGVLYTDYTASGGQRLGTLLIEGGTERTRLDGNETTDLVVGRKRWTDLGGDVRMVVRLTWPDGTITERRIAKVSTTDTAPTTQLELVPVFADLGTGGPIVRVVAGKVATRVAGELPVSVALSTYVTPHSAATRIGIVVGTIEKDVVVQFDLDAPTPAALILDAFDKAKLELELVRTSDSVWTLNGRAKRGSTAPALQVRESRNQSRLALGVDDQQLATVVVPLGDADPATGDRATLATARWSVASIVSGWVQLRDPASSAATPILVDTQWQGAFVVDRFGFAQSILNARVSDGAVQLASTAGLSVGSRVWIAADAAGTPLVEVYDASSTGARRRSVPLPLATLRGEANDLRNGRFQDGLSQWTGANPTTPPAFAEITRLELGLTRSGQANGARAAATGTGTPFAIKGLPANSFVRQWAEIKVGGATLPVTADAIPDTSGAFTLSVGGGGLPGSYADNTPFSLVRSDTRTLTLDGDQSPLSWRLQFRDSNTDGVLQGLTGTLVSGAYSGAFNGAAYVDAPLQAGRVRLTTGDLTNFYGSLAWASYLTDVYTITGVALSYTVGDSSGTFTITSSPTALVVGTRVRYFGQDGRFQLLRVTAIGGVYSFTTEFGTPAVAPSGSAVFQGCNLLLADGSTWATTFPRETRTVFCNGAVSAGATSLPCKAQTNLLTRNWTATDTISMTRDVSGTLAVTGITSTTGFDDDGTPVIGMQAVVTYNAATSTMDDLTGGGVDWSLGDVYFDLGTVGLWRLASIGGGSATLENPALWITATPFTTPQTASASWVKTDTYTLSGTASWGANGRVTLTLASAIPSGRSYARGLSVGSNWVSGSLRLHAARSGGNTTVELFGHDGFLPTSDPSASLRGALYRITASGSTVPIPGNTLYAASTAQADGSGNASVTLTAANANAIANNEAVTIVTPELLRPSDDRLGSVVRMTSAVGGSNVPTASTPGLTPNAGVPIPVPAGTTVPVTVFATFALSQGVYALGQQPAMALVDGGGAILATARLATGSATVAQTPTFARLILTHVLTVSTTVSVRLFGGSSDRTLWTIALDAMLCVTDRDDVPFVVGSWANALAIRGAEELAARRDPAVAVQLDLATLRRWSDAPAGAPVVIGQTVTLPALGLTRRVLSIDRDVTDPTRVRVEIGVPADDLSTQVGAS